METISCELCGQPLQEKQGILCESCLQMEERLNYLIKKDKKSAEEYLGSKLNAIADQENQRHDRRKKQYKPPWGTHTPERRVQTRRQKQQSNSPRRRKSDF
jgi:uncharacterized Zn finger protein (UPF0148 family)